MTSSAHRDTATNWDLNRAPTTGDDVVIDDVETKRRSTRVTRLLALLRAHGLIARVPTTHRSQVTDKGRTAITALLAARQDDPESLLQAG